MDLVTSRIGIIVAKTTNPTATDIRTIRIGSSTVVNLVIASLTSVAYASRSWEGMSVNALGYAGALLVRDQEQLRRLREAGPLAALAAVGVGKKPEQDE